MQQQRADTEGRGQNNRTKEEAMARTRGQAEGVRGEIQRWNLEAGLIRTGPLDVRESSK